MPKGIYKHHPDQLFQKGHLISKEIKNKISQSLKDHIPWNKGKVNCYSEETIKKMSEAKKNISEKTRCKMSEAKKNHLVSIKTREKMSKIARILGLKPPSFKGKHHTKESIKKFLHRRNITSLEKKFQEIINKNNLPYKFVGNGSFTLSGYNPDFINTNNEKIAIEVYAKYFKQIGDRTVDEWKNKRIKTFRKYGWDIIFFEKNQVEEENVLRVLNNKKELINNAI